MNLRLTSFTMKRKDSKAFNLVLILVGTFVLSACGKKADTKPEEIPKAPDAAVQTIISEFAQGNTGIAWKALPESYQTDVNELMHLAGSRMDSEVYDEWFVLIARLGEVIDQQKTFIAGSSFLENRSTFETSLPSIVALIQLIAASEIASVEGLLNFDGQSFFDTTVPRCVEYMKAMGPLSGDGAKLADYVATTVSVVESAGRQVTLSITIPGQVAHEMSFTKIEKRWIPAKIAANWSKNIAELRASFEASTKAEKEAQNAHLMGAMIMFEGILTKVASAETQEQFDQSLKEATLPFIGVLVMLNQ